MTPPRSFSLLSLLRRRALVWPLAGAFALGACAGGDAAHELVAVGASSQSAAMDGWKAGFVAQASDVSVAYDPIGSGGGREMFLEGGAHLAATDVPLDDREYAESVEHCAGEAGAINLPVYISPIAVVYNLPELAGTPLRLTGELLAGIFAGTITEWDDPALVAVNPGAALPDAPINAVHRSDESGTTKNFTAYLDAVAPHVWPFGVIESWDEGPRKGEGADGTSGVVASVAVGAGSIGYAEASQIEDLPAAAIEVGGEFVPFSAEAAAAVLTVSERVPGRHPLDHAYELRRDVPGTYPIVLVSYHVACLVYDDADTARLVRDFLAYVVSPEGQDVANATAGSAPLPAAVARQLAESAAAITAG